MVERFQAGVTYPAGTPAIYWAETAVTKLTEAGLGLLMLFPGDAAKVVARKARLDAVGLLAHIYTCALGLLVFVDVSKFGPWKISGINSAGTYGLLG